MRTIASVRTTLAAATALGLLAGPALARQADNALPLQNSPPSHTVVGQGASAEQAGSDTNLGRKLGVHHRHHARRHHRTHHAPAAADGTAMPNEPAVPPNSGSPAAAPGTTTAPAGVAPAVPTVQAPPPAAAPTPANPGTVPPATTGMDATAPGH